MNYWMYLKYEILEGYVGYMSLVLIGENERPGNVLFHFITWSYCYSISMANLFAVVLIILAPLGFPGTKYAP